MNVNETHRKSGITPIILTACFNNIHIAELLIQHGADINSRDRGGMTVKDYAKKLGQKKMLEFLEKRGAKHNIYREEIEKKVFNMGNREKPSDDMGFDSI
jgi:ankyrin repeat protein